MVNRSLELIDLAGLKLYTCWLAAPCFLSPQFLATTILFFTSMSLTVSNLLHIRRFMQYLFFCVWFISLGTLSFRLIYVVSYGRISFFLRRNNNTLMPESSSSSQGISLKGWAMSADNDVASDSRYGTTCLFQTSGFLLYFDKCIRSEVWHF